MGPKKPTCRETGGAEESQEIPLEELIEGDTCVIPEIFGIFHASSGTFFETLHAFSSNRV